MVGGQHGTNQPRNLRKISRRDVSDEIRGKHRSKCMLMQWGRGILIVLEIRQYVVGQNSVQDGLVRRRVYSPGNPPRLQLLRHRRVRQPAVKGAAIRDDGLEDGPAVCSIWIEGGRHRI